MARIGFKEAYYNKAEAEAYATVASDVPAFRKVIDEKFAAEYNNAELYANDELAESDYSFKKGTLTITIDDDDDKFVAELMGHKTSLEPGEVTANIGDEAPEVGYAHIIPKKVNGVKKFKVEAFLRVKWNKVTSDNKTKGEGTEFSTSTIEGTVMPLERDFNGYKEGDWCKYQTFDDLAAAQAYVKKILSPPAA